MPERSRAPAPPAPDPAGLLRAALEKIVFFEWRVSELAAELAAAQQRCQTAEAGRSDALERAHEAEERARSARLQLGELEAERARLAALLARPARPLPSAADAADLAALEAERARTAQLTAELEAARGEIARNAAERERWMGEMIEQARAGTDEPAALAEFISELRGQIIALRDEKRQTDELLRTRGLQPPAQSAPPSSPPAPQPAPRSDVEEQARKLWAEGRLGGAPARAALEGIAAGGVSTDAGGTAARALVEQCLRQLSSSDPARREQAARHLAAVPHPAAAPGLAHALGEEREPRARAQLARALGACGGEAAADLLLGLLVPGEAAAVRLAALDALAAHPGLIDAALERALDDGAPAVRRRAAALAAGRSALLARLAADPDASVRAAAARVDPATQPAAPVGPSASGPAAPVSRSAPPSRPAPATLPAPATSPAPATLPAPASPPAPADDPGSAAVLAVQSAIFGLTEQELARSLGVAEAAARALAGRLVAEGRLDRRGRRLVPAQGAA